MNRKMKVLCLTGGPGAGKTSVTEIIARQHAEKLFIVPEAASILYSGGFPRAKTASEMRCIQNAIFQVQSSFEAYAHVHDPRKIRGLICDRGTIDGSAYWPGGQASFFKYLGTSLEAELARYDVVVHMESPTLDSGYDLSNSTRTESAKEARALDIKIQKAWARHPKRFVVTQRLSFIEKVEEVLSILNREFPDGI